MEGKVLEEQRANLIQELHDQQIIMMTELEEVLSPEAAEKAHELFGRMDRRLSMQVTVPTLRRDAHHGPPARLQAPNIHNHG